MSYNNYNKVTNETRVTTIAVTTKSYWTGTMVQGLFMCFISINSYNKDKYMQRWIYKYRHKSYIGQAHINSHLNL